MASRKSGGRPESSEVLAIFPKAPHPGGGIVIVYNSSWRAWLDLRRDSYTNTAS